MTESSLLARTLWSLRSVEAVVSLLSASEIFLLLSSWSERSLETWEIVPIWAHQISSNTGLEKRPDWRLEKIPKFTLQRSFWKLSLRLGWVCSSSQLSYGWTLLPAVLGLGAKIGQEQGRAGLHVCWCPWDTFGKHSQTQTFTGRQKSLEAMGYFKDCKKIPLIQITQNPWIHMIWPMREFQTHKTSQALLTESEKLVQYIT